jgi:hypothetical protein
MRLRGGFLPPRSSRELLMQADEPALIHEQHIPLSSFVNLSAKASMAVCSKGGDEEAGVSGGVLATRRRRRLTTSSGCWPIVVPQWSLPVYKNTKSLPVHPGLVENLELPPGRDSIESAKMASLPGPSRK